MCAYYTRVESAPQKLASTSPSLSRIVISVINMGDQA